MKETRTITITWSGRRPIGTQKWLQNLPSQESTSKNDKENTEIIILFVENLGALVRRDNCRGQINNIMIGSKVLAPNLAYKTIQF